MAYSEGYKQRALELGAERTVREALEALAREFPVSPRPVRRRSGGGWRRADKRVVKQERLR